MLTPENQRTIDAFNAISVDEARALCTVPFDSDPDYLHASGILGLKAGMDPSVRAVRTSRSLPPALAACLSALTEAQVGEMVDVTNEAGQTERDAEGRLLVPAVVKLFTPEPLSGDLLFVLHLAEALGIAQPYLNTLGREGIRDFSHVIHVDPTKTLHAGYIEEGVENVIGRLGEAEHARTTTTRARTTTRPTDTTGPGDLCFFKGKDDHVAPPGFGRGQAHITPSSAGPRRFAASVF